MNHVSEYWYMFSTFARSVMQKNSTLPCSLTGLYRLRVSSISMCLVCDFTNVQRHLLYAS